jgi:hypothetical protein
MVNGIFNSPFDWEKIADRYGQYFLIARRIGASIFRKALAGLAFSRWHEFR